jgi:hypothetical protein
MRDLKIANIKYRISGSDPEVALAHALGATLIELQQLEYAVISFLTGLAGADSTDFDASFDVFASKCLSENILNPGSRL